MYCSGYKSGNWVEERETRTPNAPILRAVRVTLQLISPRFAMRILSKYGCVLEEGADAAEAAADFSAAAGCATIAGAGGGGGCNDNTG